MIQPTEIEDKRQAMYKAADLHGRTSEETLHRSEDLDKVIVDYMSVIYNPNKKHTSHTEPRQFQG